MRRKDKIDFLSLLNSNLRENPFYTKLFEAVGEQIDKQVGEPLSELERSRSSMHIKRGDYMKTDLGIGKVAHVQRVMVNGKPMDDVTVQVNERMLITQRRRALQSRKTLIDGSVQLGFNYYSELLTDEDYARVFDYVSAYWPRGGTEEFIQFIAYVKNMALQMRQLWTRDYGDNATSDDPRLNFHEFLEQFNTYMTPVWEGGTEYPTSHVEVEYDAIFSPNADLNDLIRLFYLLAPIHLVLERVVGGIYVEVEVGAQIVAQVDYTVTGNYTWEPNAFLYAELAQPSGSVDYNLSGSLYLDDQFEMVNERLL